MTISDGVHDYRPLVALSGDDAATLDILINTARRLYDALAGLREDDVEGRRALWLDIMEVQHQVTAMLTPERGASTE